MEVGPGPWREVGARFELEDRIRAGLGVEPLDLGGAGVTVDRDHRLDGVPDGRGRGVAVPAERDRPVGELDALGDRAGATDTGDVVMADQPEATRTHFGATSQRRSPGSLRAGSASLGGIGSLVTRKPAN